MATTLAQPWDVAYAGSDRWLLRFLPSLTDIAFAIPIILLLLTFPDRLCSLLRDGDTGWHLRAGEWILQHRSVPHLDLFSFTKPGQPWFAWEWAWDLCFALIHRYAGLAGVVWMNTLLLGFVSALLYRLVRRACDHDLLALALTALAMCGSMMHWLARPHLLSWVLFVLLLFMISSTEQNRSVLRWTPLLACIWTNVHGSFLLVPVTLGLCGFAAAAGGLCTGENWRGALASVRPWIAYSLISLAATLINPYGYLVHGHIWQYLRGDGMLKQISEFQSISFHDSVARFFELMLLLGVGAAFFSLRQRRWADALLIAFWAHLALVSVRNVPLFCFVAAPPVARMLRHVLDQGSVVSFWRRPAAWIGGATAQLRPFEKVERWHVASLAFLLYLGSCLMHGGPGFQPEFPRKNFPVSALPVVAQTRPQRIFAPDQWSDYLLYVDPSRKVFFDGRSDFYGPQFVDRYLHILNGRWDWNADLQRFLVDMVIVPPNSALATVLKTSPDWKLLFDDGAVVVFGERNSAVVRNGGRQLGAVSAFKYRTTT